MASEPVPRIRLPERAAIGEVIEVKTLLAHPMETGRRRGPDGALVPRRIIRRFTATFAGETVLEIEVEPAIAPNPYFVFSLRIPGPGAFTFTWEDEDGTLYVKEAPLTVG